MKSTASTADDALVDMPRSCSVNVVVGQPLMVNMFVTLFSLQCLMDYRFSWWKSIAHFISL